VERSALKLCQCGYFGEAFYPKQSRCKECIKKSANTYYQNNKDKILSKRKSGYSSHASRLEAETLEGCIKRLYHDTKSRAKKLNHDFDLDKDWFEKKISPLVCEATGVQLQLTINKDVWQSPFRPSIDRVDNSRGYTKDNCRIVCFIFNKAKADGTDEDVIKMAKALMELKYGVVV